MKNAWIVPVIVIVLTLITGSVVSLIPQKELLVEERNVNTIVINSAEWNNAPTYFQTISEKYNIDVDWSENLKNLYFNTNYYQGKTSYGEVESGKYNKAIFLFDAANTFPTAGGAPLQEEEIELGIYKANYCKENNIRTIGINLLSRVNGVPNVNFWDEKYTYEVINAIAPYMDILIVYHSENIDNRYYDLAEKTT